MNTQHTHTHTHLKAKKSNEGIITCYIYVTSEYSPCKLRLCALHLYVWVCVCVYTFFLYNFSMKEFATVAVAAAAASQHQNSIYILLDEIPVATRYWIFLSNNENKTNLKTFTSLKWLCVRQSLKLVQFSIQVHVTFAHRVLLRIHTAHQYITVQYNWRWQLNVSKMKKIN